MKVGRDKRSHMIAGEKECCILCGKVTEAVKDQPLSERKFYIEGAGQLCKECYQELYVSRHNANIVWLKWGGKNDTY